MNKKHIVCYGDSNTWGYCAATGGRYEDDARWTRLLQEQLGEGYLVAEEGVCGRTTVFEDPLNEGLCGFAHLATALNTHSPLDLLVVMLGTNDCKQRYSATAQNIADGLARLVTRAKQLPVWADEPRVLIVAPIMIDPRVHQVPRVGQEMGEGCVEKSRLLPALMEQTARDTGCEFILVLRGRGSVICDGQKAPLREGELHYCPKGHSHSLLNDSDSDLEFLGIVPQQ